jgi:penicillin-binding protein 1A
VVEGVISHDSKGGGGTVHPAACQKPLSTQEACLKEFTPLQKLKEWVIAARLEHTLPPSRRYSALYFNTVPFSDNAYGISTASTITYFSKPVDSLNVQEAAVLVGMLKGPTELPAHAPTPMPTLRRDEMWLSIRCTPTTSSTRHSGTTFFKLPITLAFDAGTHEEGPAPYFREYLRLYVSEYLDTHPKADGTKYDDV